MIPSYNRNVISGWTNSSEMVTTHKMNENEIGNRVSKSDELHIVQSVKEQRVDGSYDITRMSLRCTLKASERSYQVKILSKPNLSTRIAISIKQTLHSRDFLASSSLHSSDLHSSYIHPWFV